jgi:DNA-binding SARP family transcriptional activator
LSLLGPTALDTGREPVSAHWNRERVRSLLLYLALRRSARRDEICEALWSHLDPVTAERNLRVTLCYLQQVLEPERRTGEAPFFIRQAGTLVSLAPAPHVEVDGDHFRDLVQRAGEADDRGQHRVALDLLEEALALWRGPCLGEAALEDWSQLDRRQLEATLVRAATRAGHLHLAAGHSHRATVCADQALRVDEWSESAYRLKVAAALQVGDRGRAARELAACEGMLADLGVEPDERTTALRRRLHNSSDTA